MRAPKMLGLVIATLTATSLATPRSAAVRGENASTSTFVHNTGTGSLAFAVVVAGDAGDLHFHLEAPAEYSWVAVGTGDKMAGSVMWVAYRSANGSGVTLSPRTVDDHVEPSYDENIACRMITGNGTSNGVIKANNRDVLAVNGVCSNIAKSAAGGGRIDLASTHQNFIFGLGPTGKSLQSDSKSANMRRHALYGQFSMDLAKATVANTQDIDQEHLNSVGNWVNSNAQLDGAVTSDYDWAEPAHAVFMGGTFVILFPVGVVFLRLLEKVNWHAWMQGVGAAVAVLGAGVGIYLGREYNHSKNFNSAHQIIGLLVVLFALVQFCLGMFHHRLYKRYQRPTILGRIHRYFGPLVLALGAINGFLGFSLADQGDDNIWYGVVVGVVFLALIAALAWARRRRAAKPAAQEHGFALTTGSYVQVGDSREIGGSVPLRNM